MAQMPEVKKTWGNPAQFGNAAPTKMSHSLVIVSIETTPLTKNRETEILEKGDQCTTADFCL